MDKKRLSLKSTNKVAVRKDLFGTNDARNDESSSQSTENTQSPLKTIWGESNSYTYNQPTSNSLLLSPALKRSPNRFSTPQTPIKSPGTPRKKTTPRKLSKYSPFRKKVHNPNPKESIKRFFCVKESNPENKSSQPQKALQGIKPLQDVWASSSLRTTSNMNTNNSQSLVEGMSSKEEHTEENSSSSISINNTPENKTPNTTPKKNTPTKLPEKSNSSTPESTKKLTLSSSKITGSKDVYGTFLLRIIMDIMINDTDPDGVKLFSDEEYDHINTFNQFDQPSQRLYGRLLNRKLDWIRTSTMKYGDVNLQLELMRQNKFITSDCSNESLENLLNLLTMPDLKKLCKSYKLPESGVKSDLISRIIARARQPSIKNYFAQNTNNSSGETLLRGKIYEMLGVVIKVENGPCQTFSRCLLFFSYPHFRGLERDRFSDQLALVSQVRNLTFPTYEITRTQIFHSREHFLSYEAALIESSAMTEAKEDKNWDLALSRVRSIYQKVKSYLADEQMRKEVEAMPDFLRRFTAGGCYVRALGSGIKVLKKTEQTLGEAEACLLLLLDQRLFSRHRRGEWFEELALLYQHNLKDNVKATQAVLRGLRDEYIDLVSRHTLCARAAMLEGRKKNGLKDYLKDALAAQRGLVESLEEPPSVTISQQMMNSSRPGLKQVYIQNSADGQMLSSVEEVAREHFRQQGFTYGAHDEGGIIKSLIFTCFWNEIYGETMADGHGLFHSEYQTMPLDWNSETFYDRRREKLKSKLQDLAEGGVEAVISAFQESCENNINKESVVNWSYIDNYEITKSLIRSIDIDVFLNLSRLLLRHHRTYGAGFPDLTLWDPIEHKCIFVEVKSPNDQLSMKQRVWLHSLNKMGAKALVCHVQSVGCKGQKRRASPTRDSQ
ncbi:fanconi-associated nuclease 1-like [Homalodisca vitripennis]|uniref:fanconi-associated nuclease 1-like n=1 Tax=Homalodisca vitripennis TaxID=197043 RepID=UPI001EEBC1F4|nr:fanconi-associated nuclease 1-like [Homalodisca vitripennis]